MTAKTIDHIGIIVDDLDASAALYARVFGVTPEFKDIPGAGLKVATLRAANVAVELVSYTSDGASVGRATMGDATGLNHISIQVANINSAIAELSQAGFALQDGFPRPGAHGTVAFFEPEANSGLLLEICQIEPKAAP